MSGITAESIRGSRFQLLRPRCIVLLMTTFSNPLGSKPSQKGSHDFLKDEIWPGSGSLHSTIPGRFQRDSAGRVLFAFGKHIGQEVEKVAMIDPGYLKWMLDRPFLDDVRDLIRLALMTG